MTTTKDVVELLIQPDDVLTTSLLEAIGNAFGDTPAETLVHMTKSDLAVGLIKKGVFDAVPAGDRTKAIQVAASLQAALTAAGVNDQEVPTTTQPQMPVTPVQVILTQEKSPEQMRISELLAYVGEHPDDTEARQELLLREVVRSASDVTYAWVIPDANGRLDSVPTLKYLTYLNRSGAAPQRRYESVRPITLEQALGILEPSLLNPLVDGAIVEGLDEYGNNWKGVTRDLMEAVYWARTTDHRLFPPVVDPVVHFAELTAQPLGRRWADILEDYQQAREQDDPSAMVSLKMSETTHPGSLRGGSSPASRQTASVSLEALVRARAQGSQKSSGSMQNISGVFSELQVTGSMAAINAIVLNHLQVSGNMASGVVRTLPGTRCDITGSMNEIQRVIMSWEELAAYLGIVATR